MRKQPDQRQVRDMAVYDQVDIKQLNDQEAVELCDRLRGTILRTVSATGGHLASSLGTVELTVAIHRVFDLEKDRLVFDVGHQCYSHKLLTGRADDFSTLRSLGGVAGYPKPTESDTDAFIAGHASNSVSVALGMARARTLQKEDYHVLALLGDGALTGGLAYEGLSDAGQSGEPLIVILNDNGMSITQNVGGVSQHLAHQRLKPQYLNFKKGYRKVMNATAVGRGFYNMNHKIKTAVKDVLLPCSMFEDMGFTYMGPVDGHNLKLITRLLRYAKEEIQGPVLLHVRTVKGKGYPPAEAAPERFHGVGPFDLATGEPKSPAQPNYSAVFGQTLRRLARKNDKVCAITAAMQSGTGLDGFSREFPQRFFDVGIAEGHSVAMAAGMAKQGAVPVFAVYSSFLQRGYDMLLHDVAIGHLHVVLAVDRAGLVGEDGETHHGLFDVSYLTSVPGVTVLTPACFQELEDMLTWAVEQCDGPVAVRYPRGGEGTWQGGFDGAKSVIAREGKDITLVTYGVTTNAVLEVAERLASDGIEAKVVKLQTIAPLELASVLESVRETGHLLVAEECAAQGCIGTQIAARLALEGVSAKSLTLLNTGDNFVTHGKVDALRQLCGLDAEGIYQKAREALGHG